MTIDEAAERPDVLPVGTAGSALLTGLPENEMAQVQARLSPVSCAAGSVLIHQGSWHATMYIVRSGVMDVHVESPRGDARRVARLAPGDCIGEMALLTGSPASATVTALVASDLWALTHTDFLELLATCPTLSRNLALVLGRRLSVANRVAQSGIVRQMRLRTHPSLPSQLAEAVAASVAYHLNGPVLVLDYRGDQTWNGTARLKHLEPGRGEYYVGDLLRLTDPARPVVIPLTHMPEEQAVPLHQSLSTQATHVLTLVTVDARLPGLIAGQDKPDVDIALWPAGEPPPEDDGVDLALVSPSPSPNTRRGLAEECRMLKANVIRTLSPSPADADVGWLARHLCGLKVGLALGGGGARGYAHLGVLDALEKAGIPVDYVGGCSIGSLVAGGLAMGMTVGHMADELDGAGPHLLKFTVPRKSLLSNRGLVHLFKTRLFGDALIEDASIPLIVVAAEVLRRHEVLMTEGILWRALLASTAIPGVYPPVWVGDYCLVDGGILDPVPAHMTRLMGADVVLGVRLGSAHASPESVPVVDSGRPGRSPHVIDVMMRSFDMMMSGVTAAVVEDADISLTADVPSIALREFARGRTYIPAGYSAVEGGWSQITTLLPWVRDTPVPAPSFA